MSRLNFNNDDEKSFSTIENHIFLTELEHTPVTAEEVAYYTNRDPVLSKVYNYINHGWSSIVEEQLKPYFRRKNELSIENSCIQWGGRVIIPMQLRNKVLIELHDNHPGIVRMKSLARSYVWWPTMDENIEHISKACENCHLNQNMPSKAPIHPWENTKNPWIRVHLDFAGPYLGKMFLILADSYSKWLDVIPMNNIKTSTLVESLRQSFAIHGLPFIVVTDNGPSFASSEFEVFMK